jgi:5-formyltetrahydrofolate cyclo-ligase
MKFYEYRSDDEMIVGMFNIKEPDPSICAEVLPDIIITPLIAFDKNKHRLGYGKGYYDNTFNYLKSILHNFISVGVAYDEQLCEESFPKEDHDFQLNYIVTPNYIYI